MNPKIDIAKHLEELLYEYSSVIVPQLGAFNTRYQAATLDQESQQVSPPIKTVTFNERLKVDDGLLSSHIARTEKMPLEEVEEQIQLFVDKSLERLKNGQTVVLENIGELQKDEFQQTEFAPFAGINFFTNTFGLQTLDLPNATATLQASSPSAGVGMASVSGAATATLLDDVVPGSTQAAPPPLPTNTDTTPMPAPESSSERKLPSEVLAANATKKHDTGEVIPPPPPPKRRKKGGSFWLWFLPILILFLLGTLIWQLNTSDRSWKEHKPFSYFFSEGKDNIFASQNKGNGANNNGKGGKTGDAQGNTNNSGSASGSAGSGETNTGNSGDATNSGNNSASNSGNSGSGNTNSGNTNNGNTNNGNTGNNSGNNGNSTADNSGSNSSGSNNSSGSSSNSNNNSNSGSSSSGSSASSGGSGSSGAGSGAILSASERKKGETKAGLAITNAKSNEYVSSSAPKGYYIIVGAFGNKSNANKLVNKIKRGGSKGQILKVKGSSLNRVGVYAGTDPSKVKSQWTKAKSKYNSGAWILSYH